MKNKILYIVVLISNVIFFSCNKVNGFKIKGEAKNFTSSKVYLEDIADVAPVIIDTTSIVNNKFELKNYAENGIYRLRFGEDASNTIFLYIEKKDDIALVVNAKDLQNYTVKGSKGSAAIQNLNKDVKKYYTKLDTAVAVINRVPATKKDSAITIFNQNKKAYIEFLKSFIEKEPNNEVACFALNYFGNFATEEITYIIEEVDRLHESSPNSKLINSWYSQTNQYREEIKKQNQGGVALNSMAPNIVLQNPNGDTIQLKDLKGNYVLVDFWASWCGPCRQENPNVVRLYKQYHDKGFEIFSVSLDTNKDQWLKAIKKDGLIWKNHGCDFGYWNSAPAQQYAVQSIPATFLLDKTGKVIAKNLRGEQLAQKLAELYPAQ